MCVCVCVCVCVREREKEERDESSWRENVHPPIIYFREYLVTAVSTNICLSSVRQLDPLSFNCRVLLTLVAQSSNSFPCTSLQKQYTRSNCANVLSRKFRSPENFGPRTIFSKRNWSGRTDFFKKIGPPKKILVRPQVQQKSSM